MGEYVKLKNTEAIQDIQYASADRADSRSCIVYKCGIM